MEQISAADSRLAISMRVTWIAAFAAALFLITSASTEGQEPTILRPGYSEERSLVPGESHVYTISLNDGTAVLGEADQHGVDLVIDEFGPDGKLIRTVEPMARTDPSRST
jgi:hypothetical protein